MIPNMQDIIASADALGPGVAARFDAVRIRMPLVAEAIGAFTDPALRERAYYEMVSIINPADRDTEDGVPETGAVEAVGQLAAWIIEQSPNGWRSTIDLTQTTTDTAIAMLTRGAHAWTQLLLVKHALMDHGGFSAEQVDGDLAPLIREMAADAPVSPEVEELAARLRAEAEPGETSVQVALRLMRELHLDETDDHATEREPRPDGLNAAVEAYKKRAGTS